MTADLATWNDAVRALCAALERLRPAAEAVGVPSPAESEWYQLLFRKLRPQCSAETPVVAAIVGGTNIGKSALFNQLAEEEAGAVTPLAAGTKHPVCLVPPQAADPALLQNLFEGFSLRKWHSAEDALGADDDDLLFWREGRVLPPRLLLLDTPDIDSDAQVNWRRADAVRRAADVLLAVLTQQKYNDAAVKQFFRQAAAADKAVIILFNQVDLKLDREVWPEWLRVFCSETGIVPLQAYVVPYDRAGAHDRRLQFYAIGPDGRAFQETPVDVRRELSELRYDELKQRTLGGAVARVLDKHDGVDRYLREVRETAERFSAARRALTEARRVDTAWPTLPSRVLVDEIRRWWDERRSPWSRSIHGFYRKVGGAIAAPVRRWWSGTATDADPLAEFRDRERTVVLAGIERLLDELSRLSEVGNDLLRPRLKALLGGAARAETLARIEQAYAALPPVDAEFRELLNAELARFTQENPRATSALESLDAAAAVARPVVTVTLALTGIALPAGDVLGQAMVHVAGQTASEFATAAVVTGGGEAIVGAAAGGLTHAAAQLFRKLQTEHVRRRAAALTQLFETELLGNLLTELDRGGQLITGEPYRAVHEAVARLCSVAAVSRG